MTSAEIFAVLLDDVRAAERDLEKAREIVAELQALIKGMTGRGADPTDAVESTPHN